ncbi:HNH endonuclease [Tenacibaculum maritimum]|uniref:HNH endonuclease n=1 Tax=Tenacibaculum maritimum TaxID=107401 RepID=UPI0038773D52
MKCYLTGVELKKENKSLEHILPNALGGQLKSKEVLCSDANLKLSDLIDKEFNKIFEGTYRRLPLDKDRQTNRGIVGIHQTYNEDIVFKDNKCFPRKPIYDATKQAVYAQTEKIGTGYVEHLKQKGKIPKGQEVKIWTDLSGDIGFPFKIDNNIFPKGFAKIAAGFATLKGIDRNNLKRVINLSQKEFRNDIILLPFFPVTPQEVIFEKETYKSVHYPLHTIALKGIKKEGILYCYVELFSTFQYIVVLDDKYEGEDIYHSYFYDLLNAQEITYNDYIESVMDNTTLKNVLKEYKCFEQDNLDYVANIAMNKADSLRLFCYYKFHQLESFVAYVSLTLKLEEMERK